MGCIQKLGLRWFVALAFGAWLGGGCRTPHGPDPDSMVSAIVHGHTIMEAAHAVSEVFEKAGYNAVPEHKNDEFRLAFEVPGGGMDTALYGGWHSNEIWYRVRIRFATMGTDSVLISADTFRVRYHGEGGFETEQKLSHTGSARCRDLLAQAAARLK